MTAIAFVLAFLTACLFALARHPIYGLMAYVGVFYINPPLRWWGQGILLNFRWSVIAAAVTLVSILMHRTGRRLDTSRRDAIVVAFLLFLIWLWIQTLWAIDPGQQRELLDYYLKFGVAVFLIYRAVDSERSFRLFLWAHVLGCFYFGWLAFTEYEGGRFEQFGGAGVKDANEAALTIGTGALVMGSLLLWEKLRQKLALIAMAPFLVNAIVATVSRSGFLALAVGGVFFNLLTPKHYRKWVLPMSGLALVLLLMLTTQDYWARIETITYRGQEVEGKDTGAERLEVIAAQIRMFRAYPWGCGHACTAILSPSYLDEQHRATESGLRSSHNTFMSMLVEQGIPGAMMYIFVLVWLAKRIIGIARQSWGTGSFVSIMLPGIAGSLGAIFIGDMFVPYVRYEVRFWFVALVLVLWRFQLATDVTQSTAVRTPYRPPLIPRRVRGSEQ